MTHYQSSWRHLIASIIVAIGLAVLWAAVAGWGASFSRHFSWKNRSYENIRIAADGTPVIVTTSGELDVSRRTLSGEIWPSDYEKWLGAAYFRKPKKKPGLRETNLRWSQRFAGGTDGKKPPTAWYILRNAESHGHVYFMGIDAASNLPIGYIGRNGFRTAPLSDDEHFELPKAQSYSPHGFSSAWFSGQYFSTYEIVRDFRHQLNSESRILPWLVYLTDGEELREIDLRKRSVRTVLQIPGLRMVDSLSEVVADPSALEVDEQDAAEDESSARLSKSTQARLVSHVGGDAWVTFSPAFGLSTFTADSSEKIKTETRLGILCNDKFIVYDSPTGVKREFTLPESENLPDKGFQAYLISPQGLLVQRNVGQWDNGYTVELLWLTAGGEIERRETTQLVSGRNLSERERAWREMPVIPLPIAWLGKAGIYDPLMRVQQLKAENYSAGLRQELEISWPPIAAVVIVSLILAGIAWRWHRQNHRQRAGAWWLFVFLFGPVGLWAYWLQQCRPASEQCNSCGKEVPRDREQCAACASEFSRPAQLGTEIFA